MNAIILLLATVAVRNPFWPVGFDGPLESITAEPRVELHQQTTSTNQVDDTTTAAAVAALTKAKEESKTIKPRHWAEARKTLRVSGGTVITQPDGSKTQSVLINGNAYRNGELISVNHERRRFTWRVEGLTPGESLRLIRVRARELDNELEN